MLVDVGLLAAATVAGLPQALQPRLEELLANPTGRHCRPHRFAAGSFVPKTSFRRH
ncbi:MAG: hypothetical protein WCJ18_10800 [Planctomycetota bacterium]